MKVETNDEHKTVIVSRPRDDKFADDALTSMVINSQLVRNIVKAKSMSKDWNDDLKLLKSINTKIKSMKMDKEMPYDLFREKFSELSLQTKTAGHLEDVIMLVKNRLTDLSVSPDKQEQEEGKSKGMKI